MVPVSMKVEHGSMLLDYLGESNSITFPRIIGEVWKFPVTWNRKDICSIVAEHGTQMITPPRQRLIEIGLFDTFLWPPVTANKSTIKFRRCSCPTEKHHVDTGFHSRFEIYCVTKEEVRKFGEELIALSKTMQ